jgi:hypothetical protein
LEQLAFEAKDTLLPIDEYVPGRAADDRTLRGKADSVLRAVANGTGELDDVPRLLRSRKLATGGTYAKAMSGFICWLARHPEIRTRRVDEVQSRRVFFEAGAAHRRSPGAAAELLWGWDTFISFAVEVGAVEVGAIESCDETRWHRRGVDALRAGVAVQAAELRDSSPVERFLSTVAAALAARRVHLVSPAGEQPKDPQRCGWAPDDLFSSSFQPKGQLIGVIDDGDIYLLPSVALAEVRRLCQAEGSALPLSAKALGRQLVERGLLAETGPGGKPSVHKSFSGLRTTYWHLAAHALVLDLVPTDDVPEAVPA